MKTIKKYLTVTEANSIILSNLPIKRGEKVEVIIHYQQNSKDRDITKLKKLFDETQALPHLKNISEEEVLDEIEMARDFNR
jgi:hypothetical protein